MTTATLRKLLFSAVCLLFSAAAQAQPAAKAPDKRPSRSDTVAWYFNRTPGEIDSLRAGGFGYGEIVKIFVIAEMSRRPLPELLEENKKGYGWGTLSQKLGLHPVFVKKRVDSARRELDIRVRPASVKKKEPAAP